MDLIWRSKKMIKFGADLIWSSEKKIKFGVDLIWRFFPFCANCAKFSPRQKFIRIRYFEITNIIKIFISTKNHFDEVS